PLLLVKAAPDAGFVGVRRVLQAVASNPAGAADFPGLRAGVAVGRDEGVRVLADARALAVPIADGRDGWAGHRVEKEEDRVAASAGAFAHVGSLRKSRDGGAVSLGFAGSASERS